MVYEDTNVYVTDVYARGVNVNLTPLTSNRGALATDARGCSLWRYLLERLPRAWESQVRDPLGTRYEFGLCRPGRGCYIGAVTRMGVRFRRVSVTDVAMPVRAVCKPHSPDLKKRRSRGCSLWRYLLERPPPAWESRVRDPLGTRYELGRCGPRRGCYIGAVTRTGVRFRGVNVTDVYARGVNVNLTPLTSNRGALATDARRCSLWRYLLERPPRAWESRVCDPLGTRYEFGLCGPGRGCYIYNDIGITRRR